MPETTFSWALNALKNGFRVTREGWNGKGQYVYLVSISKDPEFGPFLAIVPVSGPHVPWLASQTDLLAEDWMVAP